MQTVSSASSTCFRFWSAAEWTATVLLPSSRQARRIGSAISPRLRMTTLSSIPGPLLDGEEGLAELDRLAVLGEHRDHLPGALALDLVHHLHRLDDAEHLADADLLAHLDESLRPGRRRGIERADHRR